MVIVCFLWFTCMICGPVFVLAFNSVVVMLFFSYRLFAICGFGNLTSGCLFR